MTERKRRVRKHVIADLSVNHVEYHILKAGHTFDVTRADYGYDGLVFTFDRNGEIENGNLFVQLKATDHISRHKRKDGLSFSLSRKDINLFRDSPFPVYLVLFDSVLERAYWVYLQKYLRQRKITQITGKSLAIHINETSLFNAATPLLWQSEKAKVLRELQKMITHADETD